MVTKNFLTLCLYRLMKKIAVYFGIFLSVVACKKLEDPAENPARGESYMKFVHANPAAPALDLYSNYYNQTNKIGSEVSHKKSLPQVGYMRLQSSDAPSASGVGTYWFHTRPAQTRDTFHLPIPLLLEKDKYQTIFNVDSAGTPKLLVFQDVFQKPDSGFALFRVFNGKINSGNLTLVSGNAQTTPTDFMQISNFVVVPIDNQIFNLIDSNGNTIGTLNNLQLKNRQVYTFFYSDSLHVTQHTE